MRNTPFTIPDGMPLTNHLDKMTREQGRWAIRNGDAWLAYLREQQAAGVDVELVESKAKQAYAPPSTAEKYAAICDVLENVWRELTDDLKGKPLGDDQVRDWVDILQWAVKEIPVGYERHRDRLQTELREYQTQVKGYPVRSNHEQISTM